jgi:hypothetical protein
MQFPGCFKVALVHASHLCEPRSIAQLSVNTKAPIILMPAQREKYPVMGFPT